MWNALNNPQIMNTMINIGSLVALTIGLGVIVSLGLGTPVKMAVPVRRKR